MTGFRRVVVGLGLDGSHAPAGRPRSWPGLTPPRGGRVVCVRVLEPVRMPFVPRAMRSQIAGQADAVNRSRVAAARLARGIVRTGLPLAGLFATVRAERADGLGARGPARWPTSCWEASRNPR